MNLLALDQSSHITGYAIFKDDQLLHCDKFSLTTENLGQRLVQFRKKVIELIEKYEINEVAFEDIQMQSQINNVQTFKVLAEIFGITQELLSELNIPYSIISSNTWKSKLNIKGRQRAEQKRNAQKYVLDTYNRKVTQDEADSICIGATYIIEKNSAYNWD